MRSVAFALLCTAAVVLSACTTKLMSRPDEARGDGVPYRLPILQYTISVTYTLETCRPEDDDKLIPLRMDISATPMLGEGETRLIDYSHLSSVSKTSAFSVEYFDKTQVIKSINASVTDKGPEIAASILEAAVTVAKVALLGGAGAGAAPPAGVGPVPQQCRKNIAALVGEALQAKKAIEKIPDESQEVTDRLAVFATKAQLGTMTTADKAQANKDLQTSKYLAEKLAKLREQMAGFDKRLSYRAEWTFPASAGEHCRALQAPPEMINWQSGLFEDSPDRKDEQRNKLGLLASLIPVGSQQSCPSNDMPLPPTPDAVEGIVYRTPAPGTLRITCGAGTETCGQTPKPYLLLTTPVPQFGVEHVLSLTNGWGQDNDLTATFGNSGELVSFKYESKSAPAEKAAALVSTAAEDAASIVEARREKKESDATAAAAKITADQKAESDAIQHQIDVLTLKANLAKLQADAVTPDRSSEIDALKAEIAILQLRKQEQELLEAAGGH